jgi:mono/diheme cytochrome c family protein
MRTYSRPLVFVVLALGGLPARADDGAAVYKAHCASCHGNGSSPAFMLRSADEVRAIVTQGKGRMPAVPLSLADLDAVAKYTASSHKNEPWYAPGR